jgi:mannose-6-phosphate isomerase-like protein (cupin superfamily)
MPRLNLRQLRVILEDMDLSPVDLTEKLSLISELWSPKTVARLNDYEVKVVRLNGEFTWHAHDDTDELFLVISGQLTVQMREGTVTLGPGQLFIVPRGVEHCPITEGEVHAVLIEPIGVVNTGAAGGPLTAAHDDSLA